MQTLTIYANYGLLGAEKRTIYSAARGDICDTCIILLPDGWQAVELIFGGTGLESPGGQIYMISEAIHSIDDAPWLDVTDDTGKRYRRKLKIIGGSYRGQ